MTVSVSAGLLGHGPDEILLAFTTALRAAGVPVTSDRSQTFLAATSVVGLDDVSATYAAGRATLCGSPDDLDRYDQVFEAFFDHRALSRAGVVRPFHWAFAFFAFLTPFASLVYVIGRSVVVHRRSGRGRLPMWIAIAILAIGFIAFIFTIVGIVSAVAGHTAG